jgi:type II secretory pathway component PulM
MAGNRIISLLADSEAGRYLAELRQRSRIYSNQLRERYRKLERREQYLVQIGSLIFGVFLLYNLVYQPIMAWQSGLEDDIQTRERDVANVRRLTVTYQRVQQEVARLEKQTAPAGPDFALSSVLATALGSAIGNDKIGGINADPPKKISPQFSQYQVALKLSAVSLAQLVDALYQIKTLKVPVVVSDISIKKRVGEHDSYDVDMTCLALARNA